MQDAQRTLTIPWTHATRDDGRQPQPQPQHAASSWSALAAAASDGWCVYPAYRSSFVFDEARYDREYMPPNQTCATLHASRQAASSVGVGASVAPSIPFDVSVDSRGVLHIRGCVGGRLAYSLEHDAGPMGSGGERTPAQEGGWAPSLATLQSLGSARPQTVLLPYPASFVFVWCDLPSAPPGSSTPTFLPVHTPVPEDILRTRPKPRRRSAQGTGRDNGSQSAARRNIIFLELDALSAKLLPLLMPRTYALLESMRPTKEAGQASEDNVDADSFAQSSSSSSSSSSSPFVSAAPSHTVAYRFTRTALSGTNSVPSYLSLFGGGSWAAMPPADSSEWLWNTARAEGFTTGFGENGCSFDKYEVAGLDSRTLPPPGSVGRMDYNALLSVCHLPLFPGSGWTAEVGPRCVGELPTWQVTLESLRLALARQSAATLHAGSDPLASHPLLYSQVLMEAHEPSGFLARHMDASGFADTLAQMLASPAMQNGIMLLYSDHGLHFGTYSFASAHGSQEHLEPFLYVLTPKDGPGALSASEQRMLQLNADRLTSPFDWHKTVMALIRADGDGDGEGATAEDKGAGASGEDAQAAAALAAASVPVAYNLLRESVPADRACEQLPHEPLDDFWNPSRRMAPLCLCESPFSRVCRTRPTDLAPSIWNECTQLWGHPLVFDAEFYAAMHRRGIQIEQEQQQGGMRSGHARDAAAPAGVDFGPCAALHHWCTRGMYLGLQSSGTFHLRALMTLHPSLALHLADPLSFVRRFVRETHAMRPAPRTMFPPPSAAGQLQPMIDLLPVPPAHFAAFAPVSLTSAQLAVQDELQQMCGEPPDAGAQVWLRAITMQSKCEVTDGAAEGVAEAADRAIPAALSPLESASLLAHSRWQCFHWCMFDLDTSSPHSHAAVADTPQSSALGHEAMTGWEVTGGACLQRFTNSGSGGGGSSSVCVTQFAALKAQAMQLKNEASATPMHA